MIKTSMILALAGLSTFSNAAPTMKKRGGGGKRGLAFGKNHQSSTSLFSQSSASWGYDWEARVADVPLTYNLDGFEFVPMLHDNSTMFTDAWKVDAEAAIAAGSKHVISINEPDECGPGGTCTKLSYALQAHKDFVQPIAENHPDVKIGSIAVNNGVGPTSIEDFQGLEYLGHFLDGCADCRIDFVCVHWYGDSNLQGFTDYMTYEVKPAARGMPVWLTEFLPHDGADVAFIQAAIDWMEKPEQDWIERYAVHDVDETLAPGGVLSELGAKYASG